MAVSKTKAKLVDVARQLFAKNGVDNTTMNDIAVASKKGRRTLYTYFKCKEEIYMAVVDSELEMLSEALEKVAAENIAPDIKILKLIETHLDTIKIIILRNGTLRAGFFRDIWRVERVRRKFDTSEITLFRQILAEGKEQGIFDKSFCVEVPSATDACRPLSSHDQRAPNPAAQAAFCPCRKV